MSSFGVGELGLHLLFETPATIALRRAVAADPASPASSGVRDGVRSPVPMFFSHHPSRTFLEIVDPDPGGLRPSDDLDARPGAANPAAALSAGGSRAPPAGRSRRRRAARSRLAGAADLPPVLVALEGRERERLPDGSHVAVYKDALYADHDGRPSALGCVPPRALGRRLHDARAAQLSTDDDGGSGASCWPRCRRRCDRPTWWCGPTRASRSAWGSTTSGSSRLGPARSERRDGLGLVRLWALGSRPAALTAYGLNAFRPNSAATPSDSPKAQSPKPSPPSRACFASLFQHKNTA